MANAAIAPISAKMPRRLARADVTETPWKAAARELQFTAAGEG